MTGTMENLKETVAWVLSENPSLLNYWKKNLEQGNYRDEAGKQHLINLITIGEKL